MFGFQHAHASAGHGTQKTNSYTFELTKVIRIVSYLAGKSNRFIRVREETFGFGAEKIVQIKRLKPEEGMGLDP